LRRSLHTPGAFSPLFGDASQEAERPEGGRTLEP
jgi:hypothetical protein